MPTILTRREFHLAAMSAAAAAACGVNPLWAAGEGDVRWLAEVQRAPENIPDEAPKLKPLLIDAEGKAIASADAWLARRAELRSKWRDFLGKSGLEETRRPELQVVAEDQAAGVLRQLVRYEIEPGLITEAYLLKPLENPKAKRPGVVVFHSTVNHSILQPAGLGRDLEKAFGWKLAQRGFVAFCPRNFLWPDNQHISAEQETKQFQQRHPKAKGMNKMLYDARVAVNILASLPEVDSSRLGAVGHSLGAKEVLYLPAFDDRIQVTVSSEGGIGTTFSNWEAAWYLGPSIQQPGFDMEHHELLAMAAPRAFLLIGGDSADGDRSWPFIEAALPVYRLFGGTPRVGLYNHRKGHAVPPECEQRIYEWFQTYL